MKLAPHRSFRYHAFLLFPFIALALLASPPPGRTNAARRTPPSFFYSCAQGTSSTNSSAVLKFTVTVRDREGNFISGLTKDDFAVFEGKSEREIVYFNGEELPASVGILIDVSGSMRPDTVHGAKLTTARFIQRSLPDNEYFVGEFNDKWQELTDWTRDEETIVRALRKAATSLTPPGGAKQQKPLPYGRTALYDAIVAALGKMARDAAHPKRVLFIITDGWQDNASTHKLRELQSLIKTSDVLIYAIGLPTPGPSPASWQQEALYDLLAPSGGWFHLTENDKEVEEVVDGVALALRRQYVIGFVPSNSAQGGKWNKVKIKVKPTHKRLKNLFIRSRDGYFSPVPTPAP